MRATVTIEKEILDELLKEMNAKTKSSAVRKVIDDFLRRKRIERIKTMKGRLGFDLTAYEIRHYER